MKSFFVSKQLSGLVEIRIERRFYVRQQHQYHIKCYRMNNSKNNA